MQLKEIKDMNVLIAGFSIRSGVGAARLLDKLGAKISIWDEKSAAQLKDVFTAVKTVSIAGIFVGTEALNIVKVLDGIKLIVLSPGVPLRHPLFLEVLKRKIKVISEVELAWMYCPCKWICVTGTDGKTTTTTLLGQLFKDAKKKSIIGGNIGQSLCDAVVQAGKPDYIIAELSSFQLETIDTLRPSAAIILNITPDHLDRYNSMMEYADAKFRISRNQTKEDLLVIKEDDSMTMKMFRKNKPVSTPVLFSRENTLKKGAYIRDGYFCYRDGRSEEKIFPVKKMLVRGEHNKENILAAIIVARSCGIPLRSIARTLSVFRGVVHRTEQCGVVKGRMFINDSKATTLNAVRMALLSMEKKVILLMGGQAKGDDFRRVEDVIGKRVKMLVLFGAAAGEIDKRIRFKNKVRADKLADAVKKAWAASGKDDVILLSPGCTSYDEFNNFEERGDHFKKLAMAPEKIK